jgi:hypothetical protein
MSQLGSGALHVIQETIWTAAEVLRHEGYVNLAIQCDAALETLAQPHAEMQPTKGRDIV